MFELLKRSQLALLTVLILAASATLSHAQVYLNEICAKNSGAAQTPIGTTPDYIEIYNTSLSPVAMGTWTLTDSAKTPAKWRFPSDLTLPARSFLIIWLDTATNYPGVVCPAFGIKGSGETVQLYQGLALRDSVTYGPQVENKPISRIPDGTGPWQLGTPTAGTNNSAIPASLFGTASALRLNEWMATNSTGSDWLEVYNPKTNGIVSLGGLVISDQTSAVSTAAISQYSYIDPGNFVVFYCDDSAGGDHLPFKLSSTLGETLSIYQADKSTIIDRVSFGPQTRDISMGRLPDGGTNILHFSGVYVTPEGPNAYQDIPGIVINEVLAHSDPPLEDAVEFYNTTASDINLGNWWMSNDSDNPYKFRIPAGTVLAAKGYLVLYEQNQFNGISTTPGFNRSGTGNAPDFVFNSAHGDTVALFEALPNGALTGGRLDKSFGASANGISFGRYVKSDGGTDFVPMSSRSFGVDSPITITQFRSGTGKANPAPIVGPVVIREIFYQPALESGSTNDNTIDEFVELSNFANYNVSLFDTQFPTNTWRLRGGIDFDFPRNLTINAGESLLVVNFDPVTNLTQLATFSSKYSVPASVKIFGPYGGKLSNLGDSVELRAPDAVQLPPHPDAGFVPYLTLEKVKYEAGAGWPTNAAGTGLSIQRKDLRAYANDQVNWFSAAPTPGWVTSSEPAPAVQLLNAQVVSSEFTFSFTSQTGHKYKVESATSLASSDWTLLSTLDGTGGLLTVKDPVSALPRFYRVKSE